MKKQIILFLFIFFVSNNLMAKKIYQDNKYTKYMIKVDNIKNINEYLRISSSNVLKALFKKNKLFKNRKFKIEVTYLNKEKIKPFKRAIIYIKGYKYTFLYINKYKLYYMENNNPEDKYMDNKFISLKDINSLKKQKLKFSNPLEKIYITSLFDLKRFHPVLHKIRPHRGIDFRAKRGTPIYATQSGQIIMAQRYGSYGNYIKIKHAENYETEYAHLSKFYKGKKYLKRRWVKKGDIIGYSGNTGRSTGPHLHFGIKKDGKFIDPLLCLPNEKLKLKYLCKKNDKFLKNRKLMTAIIKKERKIDYLKKG